MIASAVLSVVLASAICLLSHDGGALIISNVVSDSSLPPLLPGTTCIVQDCHVDSNCSDYA